MHTEYIPIFGKIASQFIAKLAIAIPIKKSKQNKSISELFATGNGCKEKSQKLPQKLSYIPICWQCGSERDLLTLHTGSSLLFVCRACGGDV